MATKSDNPAETKFQCSKCPNSYTYFGHLVKHIKNRHDVDDEMLLTCDKCGKSFDSIDKLNRHKKSHF